VEDPVPRPARRLWAVFRAEVRLERYSVVWNVNLHCRARRKCRVQQPKSAAALEKES